MTEKPGGNEKLFTFWSGGWALALGGVLSLAVAAWVIFTALSDPSGQPLGDGVHVESYGFDLSNLEIPRDEIVIGSRNKDYIRALVHPQSVPSASVPAFNRAQRGKFLVGSDRVIGVTVGEASRAYPIRFVRWHEIVNDNLGGVPIAVTYHYLCDSVVVFDRRVAGETRVFGVSGLLHNSNLLLYDRRPKARGESLWCQMTGRAVAGPAAAAGRGLKVLPCEVVPWSVWNFEHEQDTLMKPPSRLIHKKLYKMLPASGYFGHDDLLFPVKPLPPASEKAPARKARIVVVRINGHGVVYPLSRIAARVNEADRLALTQDGVEIAFEYHRGPDTVRVKPGRTSKKVEVFHAAWFAWHAFHPEDRLFGQE